jgi:hypothetical protein
VLVVELASTFSGATSMRVMLDWMDTGSLAGKVISTASSISVSLATLPLGSASAVAMVRIARAHLTARSSASSPMVLMPNASRRASACCWVMPRRAVTGWSTSSRKHLSWWVSFTII